MSLRVSLKFGPLLYMQDCRALNSNQINQKFVYRVNGRKRQFTELIVADTDVHVDVIYREEVS